MERRNFLKGIFGAYAGLSGYFSFKYFENKNKPQLFEDRYYLERVEIPIVYHCNLNCASCDHFASIAPKYCMSYEVFKKDVERLSFLTKGKIKELTILGGEPFLNKDIENILIAARNAFPESRIEILTNGTLMDKMPDSFYKTCTDKNIGIYISYYRTGKKLFDFDTITEKIDKFQTNIRISYPKLKFQLMEMTKEANHDIEKRYPPCFSRLWPILDQGKFYSCSTINGIEKFFNKKFPNLAIEVKNEDVLDIYKINSGEELLEFYNKPKPMCAHCNYYISHKRNWALSKKEANEWYKG